MSDTPRTDQWEETGIPTTELCRLLERELAEAQHRIRTLIEERDSARIQADRKWNLRKEFKAMLGTDDVEEAVNRMKELIWKANR